MRFLNKNTSAFSLVELAVVIAIMGAIIAGGLMTIVGKMEVDRVRRTSAIMREVIKEIDDYADHYGHLPCPADPALKFGDNNFGIQSTASTEAQQEGAAATTCDITPAGIVKTASGNVIIGGLPVYTLNLPPEFAIDGWNDRFTYVVDEDLTFYGDTTTIGLSGAPDANINITIQNAANTALPNPAAVVLISYGKNKFGAWGGRGSAARNNPTGGSADEDENANDDNIFVQSILSSSFDDIVIYAPKWQLAGPE